MKIKNIIFDFDGTLADSKQLATEITLLTTQRFRVKNFDITQIQRYEEMHMRDILKEYRIPVYKIPLMVLYFRRLMKGRIAEIKPVEGLESFLQEFENNLNFYVASSNSKKNILKFFLANNITQYFLEISSSINLFGKSSIIKKIIRKHKLDPQHTIYIGDEARDIEAAHKAGIKTISVTWGFNSRRTLEKYKPLHIVDSMEELKRYLLKSL